MAPVDVYCDEACDAATSQIEETENGFRLSLDVPSDYWKFIIGKKGETKKRLENETRTQIKIPGRGREGEIGKPDTTCFHDGNENTSDLLPLVIYIFLSAHQRLIKRRNKAMIKRRKDSIFSYTEPCNVVF